MRFLICFTVLCALIPSIYETNIESSQIMAQMEINKSPMATTAHGPIIINNNITSFTQKTGSGTPADPYIIQNLEISSFGVESLTNRCISIVNSNAYIILRNITIQNVNDDDFALLFIYLENVNNTIMESITIKNCIVTDTSSGVYPLHIFNCNNITIKDIQISDSILKYAHLCRIILSKNIHVQSFNISQNNQMEMIRGLVIFASENVLIQSFHIANILDCTTGIVISIGSTMRHILIDRFIFENITSSDQMILFENDGSGSNVTIQNSIFRNLHVETMSMNNLEIHEIYFRNNIFQNIFANQNLQIFRCAYVYDSEFSSNLFQNLTSNLYAIRVLNFVNTCSRNLIFNNTFSNFTSRDDEESCIEMVSSCEDNRIYFNRFLTGSLLVEEKGDNIYQGVIYFAPYQSEMMVGNYWFDHAFDDDKTLHYFVNTPRIMHGNPNGTDYIPLHYYGMDFDGDGLINFYELEYGWQVWNPDTDNDGILDGDEIPPTDMQQNAWNHIFENPQTVVLIIIAGFLGIIAITSLMNFNRKPKISMPQLDKVGNKTKKTEVKSELKDVDQNKEYTDEKRSLKNSNN